MTLNEYKEYIYSEFEVNALDTVYISPAIIFRDGKMKVLKKRLKTFFEEDKDINRNKNIKIAFEYGYKKTEIANFLNLSTKTINVVLNRSEESNEGSDPI
jgi:DNA-binding NarL/FixJ family response regulator